MNTSGPDGKPIPVVLKKKIIAAGDELVDASAGPATSKTAARRCRCI